MIHEFIWKTFAQCFVGKSLVWEEKIAGAATIVADSRV